MLDCPISESQMRILVSTPVLSIVVPTYQRSDELAFAVASIAEQLTGGLEQKVEIVITDNASGPDTVGKIKWLAANFPTVSYMLHKRDEGSPFQFFAAPWRARGRYTWVFGSDDAVLAGGIAQVLAVLEGQAPSFLALNKKLYNADLSQELWSAANTVPDRRFDRFEDLVSAMGINQLAFISSCIENTETARALDPASFLTADTRHPHVAGFLAKHHGKPACYSAHPRIIQRMNVPGLAEQNLDHVFDYAVTLPLHLTKTLEAVGAPADFFESMNGDRRIDSYDPPLITFIDNIFENLLRSVAGGRYFTVSQRRALEVMLAGCRPERLRQLTDIWRMQEQVLVLEEQIQSARSMLDQGRQACLRASQTFTREA